MKEALIKAQEFLEKGVVLLYPTDTIWGIGCDATNEEAIAKVYRIKQRLDSKSMICLMSNVPMLERHFDFIPEAAYDIVDLSETPTTLILDNPKKIAPSVIAKDSTVGVRVARDKFCRFLIQNFKKPIVSTSANISGQASPKNFEEISDDILKAVDYIVPLEPEFKNNKPSTIIRLKNNGEVKIIRS